MVSENFLNVLSLATYTLEYRLRENLTKKWGKITKTAFFYYGLIKLYISVASMFL